MAEKVIPLADHRYAATVPIVPAVAVPAAGHVADKLGRPLRDLRISVTDRCNFRCSYCMPKEVFDKNYQFLISYTLAKSEGNIPFTGNSGRVTDSQNLGLDVGPAAIDPRHVLVASGAYLLPGGVQPCPGG